METPFKFKAIKTTPRHCRKEAFLPLTGSTSLYKKIWCRLKGGGATWWPVVDTNERCTVPLLIDSLRILFFHFTRKDASVRVQFTSSNTCLILYRRTSVLYLGPFTFCVNVCVCVFGKTLEARVMAYFHCRIRTRTQIPVLYRYYGKGIQI